MMAIGREVILSLYRNLIRESKKWHSYNYRMYALRKVKDEFQKSKTLNDAVGIEECYKQGLESLALIKRQVTIGNLYSTRPLVIEKQLPFRSGSQVGNAK